MLVLHKGASEIDYDGLRSLPIPDATDTHVPIPHHRLVDMLKHSLTYFGHEIVGEQHGVMPDGMRYFGVLMLKSPYGDYTDMVGLRNSHDKSFPAAVAFGSRVFICDNMAFQAEHVFKRKHTKNALRDIHGLMGELIEPLADQRKLQHVTFERYKTTALTEPVVNDAILSMYRQGVINVTTIADVVKEYDEPSFEEFAQEHSAWRLFNAATFALTGKVAENPQATKRLHTIIDGVCERIH